MSNIYMRTSAYLDALEDRHIHLHLPNYALLHMLEDNDPLPGRWKMNWEPYKSSIMQGNPFASVRCTGLKPDAACSSRVGRLCSHL